MNKMSYILSPDEVKEILFTAGVIKPYKNKMILLAIISVLLIVLTFVPSEPVTYSLIIALLFTNTFAYFGYKKHEENTVRSSTTGEVTVLTAYDDYINVVVEAYEADWNIIKQDVFRVLESDNHIIINLDDGRLMAVPKRCITAENKQSFEKVLNYFSDMVSQETEEKKELGE